jgi:hypothetical protein
MIACETSDSSFCPVDVGFAFLSEEQECDWAKATRIDSLIVVP